MFCTRLCLDSFFFLILSCLSRYHFLLNTKFVANTLGRWKFLAGSRQLFPVYDMVAVMAVWPLMATWAIMAFYKTELERKMEARLVFTMYLKWSVQTCNGVFPPDFWVMEVDNRCSSITHLQDPKKANQYKHARTLNGDQTLMYVCILLANPR